MGRDLEINGERGLIPCSRSNWHISGGTWSIGELLDKIKELTNELQDTSGEEVAKLCEAISVYGFAMKVAAEEGDVKKISTEDAEKKFLYEKLSEIAKEDDVIEEFWYDWLFYEQENLVKNDFKSFHKCLCDSLSGDDYDHAKIQEMLKDHRKIEKLMNRFPLLLHEMKKFVEEEQSEWMENSVEIQYD